MIILDGKKVSAEIRAELKTEIEELKGKGKRVPGLVTILVGENPSSHVYVKNKIKACEEIGMLTEAVMLDASVSEETCGILLNHIIMTADSMVYWFNCLFQSI
jgi:methylenetetrahydrofolate dehydrogenase (NADP+) / methenyltetrahydrofolate cyclohydrolase